MIEQAFVSGRVGAAFIVENGILLRVDVDEDGEPRPCPEGDAAAFAAAGAEFEQLPQDQLNLDTVRQRLQATALAYEALTLTISGMDVLLPRDIRRDAIEAATSLVADPERGRFVRNRLLGCPLAEEGDPQGGAALAAETGSSALADLYGRLNYVARSIKEVHKAWALIRNQHDESHDALDRAYSFLVEAGAFGALAEALADSDLPALHDAVLSYGTRPEIQSAVPRSVHLLRNLTRSLEPSIRIEQPAEPPVKPQADSDGAISLGDPILDLIATLVGKRENEELLRFAADEAKERVDKQIDAIANQLREGRLTRAHRYLLDLVHFQAQYSRKEHLVKTFCALATQAVQSHLLEFAAQLLGYAAALGIEDPFIVTCDAELLRKRGDLAAALAAYDAVIERFPDDVVARAGRAEVLKEQGDLAAALAAYDAVIERFPDNVVARNGRAEVLKEQGDLAAALAAYDAVIERFPHDSIARSARAGVLLLMGRVNEARAGLLRGAPQRLQDWIDYHILGMADLREGRIGEATERFAYGHAHAPAAQHRSYFASALAVARLRAREFRKAREVLSSTQVVPSAREREKFHVLLLHAQAGVGDVADAAHTLQQVADVRHPKLVSLRDYVARRFGLFAPTTPFPAAERTKLDVAIDRIEFELALAA